MGQVDGDVNPDLSAHLAPSAAEEPIFGKVMTLLYTAIKERIGILVFGFAGQKPHIIRVFRGRKRRAHFLNDVALNHHEPRRQMFHLGEIVLHFNHVANVVDVVSQEFVLHNVAVPDGSG